MVSNIVSINEILNWSGGLFGTILGSEIRELNTPDSRYFAILASGPKGEEMFHNLPGLKFLK